MNTPDANPPPSKGHLVEGVLSRLLIVGVTAAAAVIALGLLWWILANRDARLDFSHFTKGAPLSASTLASELRHGDPKAIVTLGVLLLILTPIARVAFALIAFLVDRDRFYALVAIIALGLLALGLSGVMPHGVE